MTSFAVRRFAHRTLNLASVSGKSSIMSRSFVSSRPALGGHGGHGDHDDEHPHPIWEELPFKKSTIGPMLLFALFGGVGITVFSCTFQNKKHGFTK